MATPFDRIPQEQSELLTKYWQFYRELDFGRRMPASEAQRHFVEVCRGRAVPKTEHETAYLAGRRIVQYCKLSESETRRQLLLGRPQKRREEPVQACRARDKHEYHEIDVDRWSKKRRTVRRYNW